MDPLFERRTLTKKVHVLPRYLQKNIQASLLSQLRHNYEGRCSPEGYIQKESIVITHYSLGRINYTQGGVDYDVTFQADVCMPHSGQHLKAEVNLRSKIGIHAEVSPLKVLIPRDLHLGNADFESAEMGQSIEFEVVGAQFKQQDVNIVVVGRLLSTIKPDAQAPLLSAVSEEAPIPRGTPQAEEGAEKSVVITAEKPKRKLKKKGGDSTNGVPPLEEGTAQGSVDEA